MPTQPTTTILMRMFGRPEGALGRLGGRIMARMNAECGAWVASLLAIAPTDSVLEVGFGPGVTIRHLASLAPQGRIAGVDPSAEMVSQARERNIPAIKKGLVELRQGSVERMPFADGSFDKALAINSLQVWPDAMAGLREIHRVMKRNGRIALGFTPYSGRSKEGLDEMLRAAGYTAPSIVEDERRRFCMLATKP